MDRRAFFRCLPGVAVASAAGVASVVAAKPHIEDVDGITVSKDGGLHITNCVFNYSGDKPALVVRQA